MTVKHSKEVKAEVVAAGEKTTIQVLISSEEAPHFAMRRFVMKPGGGMPKHTNRVEHEQFVLNGEAAIGIGDQVFTVKKGDVVFIPAGTPHWYRNTGNEDFVFLCMVPNQPDKIEIMAD